MKKTAILFVLAAAAISSAQAETRVGVSVGIDEPGFYGRIEIGNRPPPPVVYTQPVIIVNTPVAVHRRPIYMHVPPGHQKHWGKHCHRYDACNQPVYFVRESWVHEHRRDRSGGHVHVVDHRGGPHAGGKAANRGHDHRHDGGKGRGHGRSPQH